MRDSAVLIVGAGPTGLALACDLARRNVDFRVIDKAPVYFAGSRGKGLQPRTLEIFDDFGVINRILSQGRFHLPFRAYDGANVLGERDLYEACHPTPDVPYESPLIIPQWRVEETLRALLENGNKRVELSTELVSINPDNKGVTATVEVNGTREQIRCQYLIGADGGRSFVRKYMEFGFEGETWENARMFVGDVCVAGLDRDHWHTWPNHPDGWVGLCPLPSTQSFQFQAGIPPEAEDQSPTLEIFQRIFEERTGRTDLKLSNATWLSLYRVNIRMVNRYRNGRVLLAGDAAHIHSPVGGQGMNTGIQDSYNLGWKLGLVLNGANPSLLDTYEEERLPVAASVLGITTRLSREFQTMKTYLPRTSETLQLGISYRHSSLSDPRNSAINGLSAGDRAPDGPLTDAKREPARLFDLFRGPHFTILVFDGAAFDQCKKLVGRYPRILRCYLVTRDSSRTDSSPQAFTDEAGLVSQAYSANHSLCLIRPDGYIGWQGDSDSLASLDVYLSNALGIANE
ncbi:MAG TPA: FAD-dependent monooxygenase [Bryobacteraceae bacterium]|jgi:2-polyprenyl-6-methoxyphenol hydroxylase-like FAD-dependent oxidoreductase